MTMPAGRLSAAKPKRSAGRPKLEDVAAIEGRLLSIALQEFLTHGYGATSLTRIVKAAGVSKTTLYSRFASKEDLFRAIIQEQIERLDAATLLRPRAGRPDLEKSLKAYADHLLENSLQGDFLGVNRLITSESHRFPELGVAAAERTQRGIERLAGFVRDCATADGIPCKDPVAVGEAFILMLRGWYVNVMLTNRTVAAAERRKWIDRAVHILLAGRAHW
jgi:AcrR family transcriptional regulator